jgi:hypothetical protein
VSRGRVYLSASYSRKREVAELAWMVRMSGYQVVSTWHDGSDESDDVGAPEAGSLAEGDLAEIRLANIYLGLSDGHPTRAGHQVELGAALVLCERVIVLGPVEHHFHRHKRVEMVGDVGQLHALLGGPSSWNGDLP